MEWMIFLEQNQGFFLSFITLFSLIVGSFLNVVIYRIPIMIKREWQQDCHEFLSPNTIIKNNDFATFNLSIPRSHCTTCNQIIPAWYNIPLLSYLLLRGKCHFCGINISIQYPLVELMTALLSVFIAWKFGVTLHTVAFLGLVWLLIVLFMIDAKTMYLPDYLTYILLWSGLFVNSHTLVIDLQSSVMGAMAGYLFLWSIFHLFRLFTGKEGMGYGDFKLFAALGAWTGWQVLPFIIIVASLLGSIIGIVWMAQQKTKKSTPIPFGPYLVTSGFIAIIWREDVLNLFNQLL